MARKMFDHQCEALKGFIPSNMGALDYQAAISANVTIDPVYRGRVGHLNSAGEIEMGCTGNQMALFLLHNSDDPVVQRVVDRTHGEGMVTPKGGIVNCLVATGGYEIATTEYDTAQTYAPNESLRAVASNSNATTGGRLTNQSVVELATAAPENATAICGRVSKGVVQDGHKKSRLHFWPVHIPGASGL